MRTLQDVYPVMIVLDRYSGVYSGGQWLAVANANAPAGGMSRMAFVMTHDGDGPGSDDCGAIAYGEAPDEWIATGDDPNKALQNLLNGVRPRLLGMDMR
jgi:hypothetical protein